MNLTTPSWLQIPASFSDSHIRKPNRLKPAFAAAVVAVLRTSWWSQRAKFFVFFFLQIILQRRAWRVTPYEGRNYCGATELY